MMIKHTLIIALTIFLFSCSDSGEKITKEMMLSISDEFTQSFETRNITVYEKYMDPTSKFTVVNDPENDSVGEIVSYETALNGIKKIMSMEAEISTQVDIISSSIDAKKNQGTIEEKSTTKMFIEEAGGTIESVSLSKTTYGYINGQVKIIESSQVVISTNIDN